MVAASKYSKVDDIAFGKKNEETTVDILNKYFNQKMIFNGQYKVLDWSNYDKTIWAELKSRRISISDYTTAIIGLNKVNSCTNSDCKYYFFFKYTDGLFYIEYKKELFNTFDTDMNYKRGERIDCSNNPSAIVYVPIHLLKPVENTKINEKKTNDTI